jgi:flagellar M-ring protein FliF
MNQIFQFIKNLNPAQRTVIIIGFTVLFLFLIGLLVYSNIKSQDEQFNYTIASNLTRNQVMMASNELDNANIPYTVIGSGDNL